ncbi:hypothetical protein V5O48_017227 [Marasmius crinis-equi]|uniref:Uncharacterized protein n=1 Tax=Marasmius crinis-equi TaxID=585013 RepID=A0ABR3EPK4_9AGAR
MQATSFIDTPEYSAALPNPTVPNTSQKSELQPRPESANAADDHGRNKTELGISEIQTNDPPPDGGLRAWFVAFGTMCCTFTVMTNPNLPASVSALGE